jgi:hypothetical protein
MAAANIIINFTSNVDNGCHRVYYGTSPSGPFTSYITVTCGTGIGVPCVANIPITVPTDTCTPINYYGYIEACCNTSPAGQIPWSAIYTPAEPCGQVQFTCTNPSIPGGPCGVFNAGTGCNGVLGEIAQKADGEVFSFCYPGGVADPAVEASAIASGYTVDTPVSPECCNDCVTIQIQLNADPGLPIRVEYEECCLEGPDLIGSVNGTAGLPVNVTRCVRRGSWATDQTTGCTITELPGTCTCP